MSIEVTGAQLLELLHDAAALPPHAELLRLVDTWAEEYDRCKKLDTEDRCNLLCVLLHRSEAAEAAEAAETAETSIAADAADIFDLRTTLGHAAAHVLLCEKFPLSEYNHIESLKLGHVTAKKKFWASCLVVCDYLKGYIFEKIHFQDHKQPQVSFSIFC